MFTRMDQGTPEHWGVIATAHMAHQKSAAPLMILDTLRRLEPLELGFAANQLTHSLMTGTLARQSGASDEEVVAGLCHDMGKVMSIPNHGPIAAEVLKPYVSEDIYQAVYWHQDFQGRYYYANFGKPVNMRDAHAGTSWHAFAEKLVDTWDAPAFDPDFRVDPLESFEPEIVRVFSTPRRAI